MAEIFSFIDESNFKTPDMGEYYDEDLMEEFLANVDPNKPVDAAYYVEEPFTTKLGYYADYEAFVIKANPVIAAYDASNSLEGYKAESLNVIDGDTVVFDLDSVDSGDKHFEINGGKYKNFVDYCFDKMDSNDFKDKQFKIRSVGIDAPEIPHYSIVCIRADEVKDMIISLEYEEFEKSGKTLVYEKLMKRTSGRKYLFLQSASNKNKYHEIKIDYGVVYPFRSTGEGEIVEKVATDLIKESLEDTSFRYYKIVSKDEQTIADIVDDQNMGIVARDEMIKLLSEAEDIRIVVDAKQLKYKIGYAGVYEILGKGLSEDNSLWAITKAYFERCFGEKLYKYPGFNTFGQDAYRRFMGTIYIKKKIAGGSESVWINVSKYLLASVGESIDIELGLTPLAQHTGNGISDAFNVWSYDRSKSSFVDGFFKIGQDDFDDRRKIQKEITGYDFDTYKDYTVMIGDCLFMVPPTSIRVVNQINSERVSLLRSKGSLTKTLPHTDRIIEMTLYFNEDSGINGVPIKKKLPRQNDTDETVTYYMNGLRSLISMFKYTPFLPIENQYINDDLGIEAVSLANLQIQTVPMYPKCIAATLTLQQFNYRVYLNDVPLPSPENGERYNKNVFASTINYEVMRYYYQRAMQNGEKLKDLEPLSQEYIESTMGNKTNLIPMKFEKQDIEFYILDEEWLDKMLSIKNIAEKRPLQQTEEINNNTNDWAYMIGVSLTEIIKVLRENDGYSAERIEQAEDELYDSLTADEAMLIKLNKLLTTSQKCPYLTNITYSDDSNDDQNIYVFHFDTSLITTSEITNLMTSIAKETGIEDAVKMFENGTISFKYIKENEAFVLQYTEELEIAEFFALRSTGYGAENVEVDIDGWSDFAESSNEEFYQDMKDNAIDIESLYSAKFKLFPLENIVAQQFSISMGNIMANTKLKVEEGYAPQYAGGQDTIIDFVFHTRDRSTVGLLNSMQSMAAEYLINYRKVINCWPIRINSEMTKLCGINEVVIESIDISTVPMQPGLFAIQVRAISLDRTMRNREALRRIDSINNAGSVNPAGTGSYVYKTYFDLKNVLSKAEVYPDLELPTIKELEEAGFKYIRYMKQKESRTYPDPDFYFVYGYIYTAQMMKKTITDYFKKVAQENGKKLSAIENTVNSMVDDSTGQTITVGLERDPDKAKENVLNYVYSNEEQKEKYYNKIEEHNESIEKIRVDIKEDVNDIKGRINSIREINEKGLNAEKELMAFNSLTWDICPKIKCTFTENISTSSAKENEIKQKLESVGNDIIAIIDKRLNNPIILDNLWTNISPPSDVADPYWDYYSELVEEIKEFSEDDSTDSTISTWREILSLFGAKESKEINKIIGGIFEAAAMAMSGNAEYSDGAPKDSYRPRAFFYTGLNTDKDTSNKYVLPDSPKAEWGVQFNYVPYSLIIDEDTGEVYCAANKDDAIKRGLTFGPYQIRKYHKDILKDMYPDSNYDFTDNDFLDPYYNKTINKNVDQKEYINNILLYPRYAVEAFSRIALFWVKDMIKKNIFISYFDIRRDEINQIIADVEKEIEALKSELNSDYKMPLRTESFYENFNANTNSDVVEYVEVVEEEKELAMDEIGAIIEHNKEVSKIATDYASQLYAGKIFMAVCAAVVQGDDCIYGRMLAKDIGTLTSKTRECQKDIDKTEDMEDSERRFRKLICGLAATSFDVMKNMSFISTSSQTSLDMAISDYNQKLWLEASNDPSLWVLHSFYDMIVNNKRGRMARAFPTYYMMLIDEGREIGYWKLHDNFYNTSSIAEIEVTKSRKIPADTARIVMTNMFKTFTTEDEEIKTDYEHNLKDVFNSIFSPRTYYLEMENKRQEQMEVNRITLKPGARIHLRMGYSGDASELPILFNGVIAEVNPGEIMEIIAQGDGHEISNPGAFASTCADDLADLSNESSGLKWISNFFTEGDTPKALIRNVFTTKSGFLGATINKFTNGRYFNDNMFGITHFGEIDYIDIHKDGEIMQNIYEGEGGMPWQKNQNTISASSEHYLPEPPRFTIELKDKSVWDLLHVCASSSLEFITGVTTFGLRSTIFHGRPHYYYAYDYTISDSGRILEKRKPYQQYHIIDSFSDIIGNNIMASGKDIRTVAVPIYKGPGLMNSSIEKKLPSPLYVDWDIYPEYQKTVVVNTQMTYKANKLGALIYNYYKDNWSEKGGRKIAWRMGARALKESIKDMYQGEVIIIGDTSIKPLDKVFLHDIYEDMNGAFEVEAVVHRMTPENGFTTSIFADCISTVDNRYEEIGGMWTSRVAAQVSAAKLAIYLKNKAFGKEIKPALSYINSKINKGAFIGSKYINKVASLANKQDLIKYAKLEKWSSRVNDFFGLDTMDLEIWNTMDKFAKMAKNINSISIDEELDTLKSLKALRNTIEFLDGDTASPDEVVAMLEKALADGRIEEKKIEEVKETIKKLKKLDTSKISSTTGIKSVADDAIKQLGKLQAEGKLNKEYKEIYDTLVKLNKADIDSKTAIKILDNLDEIHDIIDVSKTAAKYVDDVVDITNDARKIIKAINIGTTALAVSNPYALAAKIAWEVAKTAMEYIITKNVYTWIESTMASFNVLTIHPLKKNGTAYVAGLDGHKGLVVNSPTWESKGPIDNFMDWVFKERSGFYGFLQWTLISEEMTAIYETYNKENKLGDVNYANELTLDGLLDTMVTKQANAQSMYKALTLSKRIDDIKGSAANYIYTQSRVRGIDDPKIARNLIPINKANDKLKEYFDGILSVGHDKVEEPIKPITATISHKAYGAVTFTYYELPNKVGVYDIPFIRPDAFEVFYRFLEIVAEKASNTKYGEDKNINVYFMSGTTVGDNTWASTGYSFRVKVPELDDVEEIFKQMAEELADLFVSGNGTGKVFEYKKVTGEEKEYEVYVYPKDTYVKTD